MTLPVLLGAFLVSSLLTLGVAHRPNDCAALLKAAPALIPNIDVYVAKDYPANTTFSTPYASPSYQTPVPDLPAFCRFGAFIKTSSESKIQFEVWLPLESEWSGRFAMVGNGGDSGGVNYPDMGIPLSKYHFAVSSTDGGHNGTSYDGTWARNNTQTQIDFGHRAVHLTAQASKQIIKAYYSRSARHNYWIGCSSGGKQGLKEVQAYPDEFDGVIAGAAAQWWTHLQGTSYRINALVNPATSAGHLASAELSLIGALVLDQCDKIDGLVDGIINDPSKCKPDLSSLSCDNANANASACLTAAQIKTMHKMWAPWTSKSGKLLFPGFEPGAEGLSEFALANPGINFGPGPDFFEYQVLNKTAVGTFYANETELQRLLEIADATDPGQTNAIEAHIEPFLKRGKLMTYVGLADYVIPSGSSFLYYEHVRKAYGRNPGDSFRFFPVPGMGHCSNGNAAFNFGASWQYATSQGGLGQSSHFDAKHDMVLAMIEWVEHGIAPKVIIASKYVDNDINNGVEFQRKLCPYPSQAVYIGGPSYSANSFVCHHTK